MGKENEFGRVYQLGHVGGHFLIVSECDSVRMEDKHSLIPMIQAHERLFGKGTLQSIGTDKGYYSKKNIDFVEGLGIDSSGLQRPGVIKDQPPKNRSGPLKRRRAGIEALISHVKEYGLRRSKMKSDETTLSSGYRSVMSWNLHQMIRHLTGQISLKRIKQTLPA